MSILFIMIGGFILKCVINPSSVDSYCQIADVKAFGALVSAGVLELIFEFRGLITIFQSKGPKKDE